MPTLTTTVSITQPLNRALNTPDENVFPRKVSTVLASVLEFLRRHAPFERMADTHLEFLARRDVLIAYHSGFDRTVLDRAVRSQLGARMSNPWIDVALLAPALVPEAHLINRPLDDWLGYFDLRAQVRHNAASDAFATAELFLILLARAARQGSRA